MRQPIPFYIIKVCRKTNFGKFSNKGKPKNIDVLFDISYLKS